MKIEKCLWIPALVSYLACPAVANLLVFPPPSQSFVEQKTNPLTIVTFSVFNNSPTPMILDYALEAISGPAEKDDQVINNGFVQFSTFILGFGTGTYSFGVYNPNGDPTDCCDSGVNNISFEIEMSPMAIQPSVGSIMSNGYGTFVFPTNGQSTGTFNPNTYADLLNCFNNPGNNPNNPCPAAMTETLYSNGIRGTPFPALTQVVVSDTPEPATWWSMGLGGAVLAVLGRPRRKRANRV